MADVPKLTNELQNLINNALVKDLKVKIPDKKTKHVKTGCFLFDLLSGGGLPKNKITMLVGPPGSFKSALSGNILGGIQNTYEQNNWKQPYILYMDSEKSTTQERLINLGITNPPIEPIVDITVEKVFKIIRLIGQMKKDKKIDKDIDIYIVWDSIANTLTEREIEADDPKEAIGHKAKVLALELPKILDVMEEYNISLIIVNQFRDALNMNMFSSGPNDLKLLKNEKTIPGGNALRFNTYLLYQLTIRTVIKKDEYGFDGHQIKMKAIKNKNFAPNLEIDFIASYNGGYHNLWTAFNFLRERKAINAAGPYWKFQDENGEDVTFIKKQLEQKISTENDFKNKFLKLINKECKEFVNENKFGEKHDIRIDIDEEVEKAINTENDLFEEEIDIVKDKKEKE